MKQDLATILLHIRAAQRKYDDSRRDLEEGRRELDEAVDMFIAYKEAQSTPLASVQSDTASEEYMTARQICQHYKISTSTFYGWVRDGNISNGISFGPRSKRWKLSEIEAWLNPEHNQHNSVEVKISPKRRGRPLRSRQKGVLSYV